jgi:hypothetical protein
MYAVCIKERLYSKATPFPFIQQKGQAQDVLYSKERKEYICLFYFLLHLLIHHGPDRGMLQEGMRGG